MPDEEIDLTERPFLDPAVASFDAQAGEPGALATAGHAHRTASNSAGRFGTGGGHRSRLWVQTDYLHWWIKGNRLPPLLTTSPPGTDRADAGVLGRTDTSILFGNDRIDDRSRSGGRLVIGYWLDDRCRTGLETTWFTLGDPGRTGNFSLASLGDPILARPFSNVQSLQQDSQLVSFPGVVDGRFGSSTSS